MCIRDSEEAIREIIGKTPKERQTLLFSATFPDEIRAIGRNTMREPLEITSGGVSDQPVIEQTFYEVELPRKQTALAGLLFEQRPESSVVFCLSLIHI